MELPANKARLIAKKAAEFERGVKAGYWTSDGELLPQNDEDDDDDDDGDIE